MLMLDQTGEMTGCRTSAVGSFVPVGGEAGADRLMVMCLLLSSVRSAVGKR